MRRIVEQERFYVVLSLLIAAVCIGALAAFYKMQAAGTQLTEVANRRLQSYRLADERRHNSDDLTRFMRTYLVTGDLRYKRMYDLVLAIRNGEVARPQDYYRIYWDLVVADSDGNSTLQLEVDGYHHLIVKPRPDGAPVALQELMRRAHFSAAEFAKLEESDANFSKLVALEADAMNTTRVVDARGHYLAPGPQQQETARQLVHSQAYHAAKRAVMQPLDEFFVLLERRTAAEVLVAQGALARTQIVFVLLIALLFSIAAYLVWQMRLRSMSQLGTTPEHLEAVMAGIAAGDMPEAPSAPVGGLLAQAHITAQRLRSLLDDKEQLEQQVHVRSAELRQVMHQLVQTQTLSALGSLVAGVAHELNTPLGNASVVASSLEEHVAALRVAFEDNAIRKSTMNSFLNDADTACSLLRRNVERAATLIAAFKQVAVDQTSARRRRVDLRALVADTLETLSPLYKRKPVRIEIDVALGIELDTYPGMLEQVLTNLVNNAVLHALDGERPLLIRVDGARCAHDSVRLVIRDDGLGMAPAIIEHVFDPFFTTKLGQGGSGLGLYLVHKLVCGTLGGVIELTSVPGAGSTFKIELPLVAPTQTAEDT
ncbi:MAG: HAMP domain-containing sensor histidine kinase [Pseudomonadota bacterium]